MSGDVQPRKRKDKKKKKDELGLEEPRGTAAALGDGDVFIHSQHEHGTGGHWCAKIIFFSLLAVLITLIGLIILENRGLTELEANSVESKYSGVLEGWIEEAPEDDHYDQHTLDLKHPDDNDEEHHVHKSHHDENDEDQETPNEHDEEEDDDEHEQDEDEDNESNEIDSIDGDNDEISEEDVGEAEEVEERVPYRRYNYKEKYNTYDDDEDDNDDDDDDGDDDEDDEDNNESEELEENDENRSDQENDIASVEQDGDDDDVDDDNIDNEEESANYVAEQEYDEEHENNDDEDNNGENYQADSDENDIEENYVQDDADDDEDDEIEKIEAEKSDEVEKQDASKEDDDDDDVDNDVLEDEDDDDEPPVEQITTPPAGKPFIEIEEETTVKPIDTLAEEFEYERRQEELRKEKEEQGSQMWLKLAVGGALLVATHAVLRRATARDAPEPEDRSREETPSMADRRMTLIPDEPVVQQSSISSARPIADEEVFKKPAAVFKNEPIIKPNIMEELKEKKILAEESKPITQEYERDEEEKELYSDEEEIVEEEEEEEEIDEPPKVTPEQKAQPASKEDSDPEEVPDDVEIIDDEQIEEEVEEEDDDEEEISDVDDTELLSRLEAKYGRLPEPERPGRKDGGNSIDEWPGEPIEPYWREQLDIAEEELRQGALASCEKRVSAPNLANSGRAKWILARAIDASAEAKKDNKLLSKAISAYLNLLKINERLSDRKLVEVAQRTIDRIQFRGAYLNAEPIYRLLIRRFPQNINYRNNMTISFLMANRADLADEVLRETLKLWPDDRVALAHHGFVLKNQYNKLEEAVVALQKALEGDAGPANEPRFYYHLGDALLLLGRVEEAHEVHVRGAELGHFLSPTQRSLYNVPRLRSRPWWPVEETPYVKLAQALEKSWREILKEAEAAKDLYEQEKEGLKEKGEWSQLDIFVRGRELPGRCSRAPVTCGVVRAEAAAAQCRRGQVKFSSLAAGTRVRAHVGPTNCRLRLHLALSNTAHTYIRVDNEIREWQLGKTFIFDDSFEHEVWHNGTGTRLVLIVDLWHPDLTPQERRTLPAI